MKEIKRLREAFEELADESGTIDKNDFKLVITLYKTNEGKDKIIHK
jgi:Ca2+-binding EF-hand superfamily protein